MTSDDSCIRSSSCGIPPPAQDLAQDLWQDLWQDLAQDDESSSDCIDYSFEPGIIGQHGTDHPDIKELYRYVKGLIAARWYYVGVELFEKDDIKQLDTIKASHHGDAEACCGNMLSLWLEKYPETTWNDLIKSLNAPGLELCGTASNIERMLLPTGVYNSAMNTLVDVTTDVILKEEKCEFTHGYQQQISTKETLQELQLLKHQNYVLPAQQHMNNTSSVARAVGNTSYGERPNRIAFQNESSVRFHSGTPVTTATGLPFVESAKSYLQPNDMDDVSTPVMISGDSSSISARVCEAVSEYYSGQFVDRWKFKTDSSTINNLAALLFEKDDAMKVVVFTAGAPKKEKCSYSIKNGSADECTWGHCDGHAVSVCYRFANFFLITEMQRHKKDPQTSILETKPGGYELKKGIKLHFFTTSIPCGFMANKQCPYLSWKVPFKGRPHCLKCSSIILINAYLGIQGRLSHLFNKPVYISSITIPKYEDATVSKCTEIKKHFEDFDILLKSANKTGAYKFHIPDVEIGEFKSNELFPQCFQPYSRSFSRLDSFQTIETLTEERQAAGAVPDAEGNLGTYMTVFTLKHGVGTDGDAFRKKMTLQLRNVTKDFPVNTKIHQRHLLEQALQRLSATLNVGKALEELKNFVSKVINEKFTPHHQCASTVAEQLKEMEQCRSIVTVKVKETLDTIAQRIEDDGIIQAVEKPLPCLRQKFENDLRLVKESLDSLNKNMTEFENDAKSIIDGLTDYHAYKETLDDLNSLLEKNKSNNCDPQFCLDLMGCDWARNLGAINNDIIGRRQQQQQQQQHQTSSENENHVLGNTERNALQEPQNEIAVGVDLQTEMEKTDSGIHQSCDVTRSRGSVHQTSRLSSLPEEQESQKQQYNLDNSDSIKESESEIREESQTGTKEPNERVMPRIVAGSYENQQHQGSYNLCGEATSEVVSKLVCGNKIERDMEQDSQNHTVVPAGSQLGTIKSREEVLQDSRAVNPHSATEENMVTPCMTTSPTAHVYAITQQKSEITVPKVTVPQSVITVPQSEVTVSQSKVTVSQSETVVPEVRRTSIASEMIRSPLMKMMFVLVIMVISLYYFDKYIAIVAIYL